MHSTVKSNATRPFSKPQKWTDSTGGVKLKPSDYFSASHERDGVSKFPRISLPVPLMRPEYDVVVVGSGYGGGVAASRMARAGKSVAVLELGHEKWPGEYPSCLVQAVPEVHASGNFGMDEEPIKDLSVGRRTGLYHLILGEGQNAFVANGLGGTSLLNANVFLHADARTLGLSEWPPEIRHDPSSLNEYYGRASTMLQPQPYPEDYPPLKKLDVLQKQAKALGDEDNFYRVPQTTFFNTGLNHAGVEMKASTGSGQDCTGVNDGSKNSILMNYLPDAWNWGAEIFCECEVRYVRKDPQGNGYLVYYAWHGDGRDNFKDTFYNQLMWVRAKEFCFLGAGALGTTEILLRSKAHGLSTSPFVGQKVSGNGDILSFGYNTDDVVNGIGNEHPSVQNPCGPTITGVIDNRGPKAAPNVLDGYVIEEGAIPQALAPLIQSMLQILPGKRLPSQFHALRHLLSRLQSRLFGPYAAGGSVNRTQTYLIMSHDSNEGSLTLTNDKPYLQFEGVGRTEHVKHLENVLAKATGAIGGTLVNSPFFAAFNQQEEITVHALGGAIMSSDGSGRYGAVNHLGQLFRGSGSETYDGIVCVDGSIIPTALGVNPLATITALAERSCSALLQKNKRASDEAPNGRLDLFGLPEKALPMTDDMKEASKAIRSAQGSEGVRFTEIMEGHIYVGDDIEDFTVADMTAMGTASFASLYVSVDAYSVQNLIERSDHASVATGTFSCGALSNDPFLVQLGEVQFFTTDEEVADGENLAYKLTLLGTKGETFLLHGYKDINSAMAFSASDTWKATTTLYTTITKTDGTTVGRGILRIIWRNFVSEVQSIGPTTNTATITRKVLAPLRFISFFAKKTAAYFFSPFRPLQYPNYSKSGYFSKVPPVKSDVLTTSDGVKIPMKVWKAEKGAPEHDMPLLFLPGASVDDQIYSLPTVPVNAIEYFTSLGYRCYVPTLRFGKTSAAREGYTAYDARYDVKAAMEYIREQEGGKKCYVVCHCLGSIATGIALLTGEVNPDWLSGMTASQVFTDLWFGEVNALKAKTQILLSLYKILARSQWCPINTTPTASIVQFLLDQILRLYPVGLKGEICNSTVCHRGSLVFGRLWQHANLTHATHLHLANLMGGLHMNFLSHLMRMGSEPPHHSHTNEPEFADLVLQPGNLDRLKGLKIQFLSGGANVVFKPLSTSKSYDLFREKFGDGDYERVVVDGYGHLDTWMGKASVRDVFPRVKDHVKKCEGILGNDVVTDGMVNGILEVELVANGFRK